MTVYVNDRNEIHDVGSTTDPKLTPIEVTDGSLDDMSEALICCYKVTVVDGVVTMRTPYVPSTVLESIDRLGKMTEAITPWTASKTAYVEEKEVIFKDVPKGNVSVYMTDTDGNSVPCTFERIDGQVKVMFEERTSLATVTVNVV